MVPARSLFDLPAEDPFAASTGWLTGTLLGDVAVGICVLAVAFIGFAMMAGRLPIRRGAQVILGCFILLGAPVIASGFSATWQGASEPSALPAPTAQTVVYEREELPPADYDPYAGASLRWDNQPSAPR